MLKIKEHELKDLDKDYPSLAEAVRNIEAERLPRCPECATPDVAKVGLGVTGRTIAIASATTKFKLIPNGPKPGEYFCNQCETYFDMMGRP